MFCRLLYHIHTIVLHNTELLENQNCKHLGWKKKLIAGLLRQLRIFFHPLCLQFWFSNAWVSNNTILKLYQTEKPKRNIIILVITIASNKLLLNCKSCQEFFITCHTSIPNNNNLRHAMQLHQRKLIFTAS